MPLGAAAVVTALSLGAGASHAAAALSRAAFHRPADLTLHLRDGALRDPGVTADATPGRDGAPPPCAGDVCQPAVAVPGFELRPGPFHRSELFVLALGRAHVEPLATIAWALVATGLRLDWSPPVLEGPNANAHGWGSVMLRLRLRLDARNHVVSVSRPR
ncbi:MAG TPA: hypothetical protein VFL83_08275 [Anaeromyxobacter sp.]|nr:hypothetical protein [Anaeromyxobacter sp.]